MEENRHIEVKVIINNINDRDSISISSNTDGHMEQDLQQMPVTGGIIENFNVICNDRDHGEQYFREIYNLPQSQESSLEDTASQFFIETEANSNTKNVCKFLRKYAMLLYLIIITLTDAVFVVDFTAHHISVSLIPFIFYIFHEKHYKDIQAFIRTSVISYSSVPDLYFYS
ncbi:hypothetical protein CWI38_0375p0030 [Hamiltosporidium tvaerminnensis]|uniref:Uncharacterized protein n=1 Tax=Hamiltosporidium tvaerminnensis TaxID=1176355 RepID=A0A4Q9M0U2_9MICR|nr:hypothetical protein CWI38_0375p0030 [Hamiltosporidium tvaerminnensis]